MDDEKVAHVTMKFRVMDSNVDAMIKNIVELCSNAPVPVIVGDTEIKFRKATAVEKESFGIQG